MCKQLHHGFNIVLRKNMHDFFFKEYASAKPIVNSLDYNLNDRTYLSLVATVLFLLSRTFLPQMSWKRSTTSSESMVSRVSSVNQYIEV